MWHNIDFKLLEILGDLVPHLKPRIILQIAEIYRVLGVASGAVILHIDGRLVWNHIDSVPTILEEGDKFVVYKYGDHYTIVKLGN